MVLTISLVVSPQMPFSLLVLFNKAYVFISRINSCLVAHVNEVTLGRVSIIVNVREVIVDDYSERPAVAGDSLLSINRFSELNPCWRSIR